MYEGPTRVAQTRPVSSSECPLRGPDGRNRSILKKRGERRRELCRSFAFESFPFRLGGQIRNIIFSKKYNFGEFISSLTPKIIFSNNCLCHDLLLIEVLLEAGKDLADILWFTEIGYGI